MEAPDQPNTTHNGRELVAAGLILKTERLKDASDRVEGTRAVVVKMI